MHREVISATVYKKFTFEYAHYLPYYSGACKNTHGHSGVAEIGVQGVISKDTGMVIDFKELKEMTLKVLCRFDHALLNDWIPNPTAEHVGKYVFENLYGDLEKKGLTLLSVDIWETVDSHAKITMGDTILCYD